MELGFLQIVIKDLNEEINCENSTYLYELLADQIYKIERGMWFIILLIFHRNYQTKGYFEENCIRKILLFL